MTIRTHPVSFFERLFSWPLEPLFKQDVLILCNNGNRDTLGLLLVYCHLKYRYHLKIQIRPFIFLRDFWIKLFRPAIVINIWVDCPPAVEIARRIHRFGSLQILSPTEVVAWTGVKNFVNRYEFKEYIDGILLAGEAMKKLLCKYQNIYPNQARVVGFPTLDWSIFPLNKLFISRTEFRHRFSIPKSRKLLLLASSFSLADVDINHWEEKYSHWTTPRPEAIVMHRVSHKMREKTVYYLSRILAEHPDWHLVVKKHPLERKGYYENAFGKNKQVTIVNDIDIHDLLSVCDILIHWNSTCAVQAWGFRVPTLLLNFKEAKPFLEFQGHELDDFKKGNYIADSYAKFRESLEKGLKKASPLQSQIEHRRKYIKKWFLAADGNSAKRAADVVYKWYINHKDNPVSSTCLSDLISYLPEYLKHLFLCYALRLVKISPALYQAFLKALPKKYDNYSLELHKLRFEKKIAQLVLR